VSSYPVYVVRVIFFSFIVYYRVLLIFLFMGCQWYCPLPVISNKTPLILAKFFVTRMLTLMRDLFAVASRRVHLKRSFGALTLLIG